MARALVVAGLALLGTFTYLTGVRLGFVFIYSLGLLILAAWAWPRLAARGLKVHRGLEAGGAAVGERFTETVEVEKRGRWPAPWVEVFDAAPLAGQPTGHVISLGREPVRWITTGVYTRRGWNTFGPTTLRVKEPFGLFQRQVVAPEANRILIRPRIEPLPFSFLPANRSVSRDTRHGGWSDDSMEIAGIRDYAPGDTFSRIHWALTARQGHLMTKTFEYAIETDMWLVLDLFGGAYQDGVESPALECAVSLAASLLAQVAAGGQQVSLAANDRRATVIRSTAKEPGADRALDFLALAQPDGTIPLGRASIWGDVRRQPHRSLAVVTPRIDAGLVAALEEMRRTEEAVSLFWINAWEGTPALRPEVPDAIRHDIEIYVARPEGHLSQLARLRDASAHL